MYLARPLVMLAAAFAAGIALAAWLAPPPLAIPGVTIAALLAAAVSWQRGAPAVGAAALLLAAVGAGALRWTVSEATAKGTVGSWLGRPVVLVGSVLTTSGGDGWRTYEVSVEAVAEGVPMVPAAGLVHISQAGSGGPALLPGQRGRFFGRLAPIGYRGSDAENMIRLAERGIHFRLTGARPPASLGVASPLRLLAAQVRQRLTAGIAASLPPPQATLLAGLLLSEGENLPEAARDDFRRTGLMHVLAVDGSKVGAVLGGVLWLLARLGWNRRRAAVAAVPVLAAYCLLVGATAAAVRATLMAVAALAALAQHRRVDVASSLALSALVLLVSDPHQLLQLGFQLSFAATLGILAFYRPLARRLRQWPHWLVEPLAVTLAVELAVEPLGLHAFGGVPLVSPLVHLWAMPLLAVLVPLGGLTALTGALQPAVGVLLGVPASWLLWLLAAGAHRFAGLPLAYWQPGRLPAWGTVACYAALALLAWLLHRKETARQSASSRGGSGLSTTGSGRGAWHGAGRAER